MLFLKFFSINLKNLIFQHFYILNSDNQEDSLSRYKEFLKKEKSIEYEVLNQNLEKLSNWYDRIDKKIISILYNFNIVGFIWRLLLAAYLDPYA